MERLKNKIAVITGASSGIGAEISELFASEGADIVVNYLSSKDKAQMVVNKIESLGRRAFAIQADMSDKKAVGQLVKEVVEKFGKIDIWINNAGADILTGECASADTYEKLVKLTETDLKGTINACWSVAEVMHEHQSGVIVNMGWDLAIHGLQGVNPQIFAATKSGVLGFTRSFAKTVGPSIRVNMVAPGWVKTAFAEKYMEQSYYQDRLAEIPLGRFATPRDIAETVLFLASDESTYMQGESINVNGGLI